MLATVSYAIQPRRRQQNIGIEKQNTFKRTIMRGNCERINKPRDFAKTKIFVITNKKNMDINNINIEMAGLVLVQIENCIKYLGIILTINLNSNVILKACA